MCRYWFLLCMNRAGSNKYSHDTCGVAHAKLFLSFYIIGYDTHKCCAIYCTDIFILRVLKVLRHKMLPHACFQHFSKNYLLRLHRTNTSVSCSNCQGRWYDFFYFKFTPTMRLQCTYTVYWRLDAFQVDFHRNHYHALNNFFSMREGETMQRSLHDMSHIARLPGGVSFFHFDMQMISCSYQ